MKKLILGICFVLAISSVTNAQTPNWSEIKKQIVAGKCQPQKLIETSRNLVLHPLVKEKEHSYEFTAKIFAKEGKFFRKYEGWKHIKGQKPKVKEEQLKKIYPYKYGDSILKVWTAPENPKLTPKVVKPKRNGAETKHQGHTTTLKIGSEKRDINMVFDKNGKIQILEIGNRDGHVKSKAPEKAYAYWFVPQGEGVCIEEKLVITHENKGVPVVKTMTTVHKY